MADVTNSLRFRSERTSGPTDPPPVGSNVITTVRYRYTPGMTSPFTPYDLAVQVPQNGTSPNPTAYWQWIRIVKVSVYDTGTGSGSTPPNVSLSYAGEPFTYNDTGVQGGSAAAIHTKPPLQLMQTWWSTTNSTDTLFTATAGTAFNGPAQVQVTAEVLSG